MNRLKYRKAWRFPEQVEDFIASHCKGYVVNVMCGNSTLGGLRIDAYTQNIDIRADAFHLPLKDAIADTVVCDPPWGMDILIKPAFIRELERIIKLGGILVFYAPWNPKSPGLPIEAVYVPEWQLMTYHRISLIFIARKVKQKFI
ncbi:unnamed protein product [marine sediment metagenome]|uniref:Uncharacterized protein n=1 Tax=marine sediment metagenome TaxID=412755 RepID=X1PWQ7_9ZZZZ